MINKIQYSKNVPRALNPGELGYVICIDDDNPKLKLGAIYVLLAEYQEDGKDYVDIDINAGFYRGFYASRFVKVLNRHTMCILKEYK